MSKHKYFSGGSMSNKPGFSKKKTDLASKDQDGEVNADSQEAFTLSNKPSRSVDKKNTV
jgi:hypothetical protein